MFLIYSFSLYSGHSRTDSSCPNDLWQEWCRLWRQGQTGSVYFVYSFRQVLTEMLFIVCFCSNQLLDKDTYCFKCCSDITLCVFVDPQLIEVTGKTQDECMVALHDCNEDVNRAINFLLESTSDTVSLLMLANHICIHMSCSRSLVMWQNRVFCLLTVF